MRPDDRVWEIGPGLGALTHRLAGGCAGLWLFEIDRGFVRYLEQAFSGLSGVSIVPGDALKTWPDVLATEGAPDLITGNLPYCSAAAIIGSFAEQGLTPRNMVFTVQKEVALRMTAQPGSKEYSSFSLACALFWDVSAQGDLYPGAFYPKPEVVSRIVRMVPHGKYDHVPRNIYFALAARLFSTRRKTIRNTLLRQPLTVKRDKRGSGGMEISPEICRQALEKAGIVEHARGEELQAAEVAEMARFIADKLYG